MFICKECGQEYKNKPQYCDCGNNTFDEIREKEEKINLLEKYNINMFSLLFFISCIILSILVLLFFPPISENTSKKDKPVILKQITNIPPLDSFWVDEKPVVQELPEEIHPVEVINVTKSETKPVKQPSKTVKPVPAKEQTVKKIEQKTSNNISSQLEVTNYKISLRNKLFSNLSVSSIQGSGKCGIEFAVDSSGKLINRAFTFQSDNKSVNDEVYKMMMRTPVFSAPPSGYKGEKIKLVLSFDNGSFEISFGN